MLRKRNIIKAVKEFDAFPKISDDYRQQSAVGGTFSLASICIIVYLIYSETLYFLDSRLQFKFEPDTEYDNQLQMNIDMTVAMPCSYVGVDLDSIDEDGLLDDKLSKVDTWWDLSPDQRAYFEALTHMNYYLREEYHAVHEILWKSNKVTFGTEMPDRNYVPSYKPNACRIRGNLDINKAAGNLHITSEKSISLPGGHFHLSLMSSSDYNFTHRINRFSFGQPTPGIIYPLEGSEKVTNNNMMLFNYFIEVVSTDIHMLMYKSKTYQYSVQEYERPIDHGKGSHGSPGIFFKYDTSALKIRVTEERDSIGQFLVKLCASIGCIFVTNGLLNSIVQSSWCILCCKFFNRSKVDTRNPVVNKKVNDTVKPVNLVNVPSPTNFESVNILPKT